MATWISTQSKYYDLSSYNDLITTQNSTQITLMHINSRSLSKNSDNIKSFLRSLSTPPNVLAVTETWLTDTNKHLHEIAGFHSYHLVRNARARGGVTVYVTNLFNSEQIDNLTLINDQIEINTVKITPLSLNFLVCAVYRPNSKHIGVDEFSNTLNTLLHERAGSTNILLIGDFNINLLEHTTHLPTNNFLLNIQTLNFLPHIARPTRFPDTLNLCEPSLLDHIYTNFTKTFTSGIVHYPISDHLPIFLNILSPLPSKKTTKIEFRHVTTEAKHHFSYKLNNIHWDALLYSQDVNVNFNIFIDKFHELKCECFPLKTKYISEKRLNNPWITTNVIKSIKTKNNLCKDYKVGAVTENQYKLYRNMLNRIISNAKKSYYMNIFTNYKNDTKKFGMQLINSKTTTRKHI